METLSLTRRLFHSALRIVLVAGALVVTHATATIPDASGVIHGCYSSAAATARIIDASVTTCRPNEIAISWNVTGPTGSPGSTGSPGPRGPSNAFSADNSSEFASVQLHSEEYVVLLTLSLPAGNYVANAVAGISSSGTAAAVQCAILKQSINFPVGVSVQSTTAPAVSTFLAIPLVVAFTLDASDHIELACRSTASAFSQPSAMTATQVETLTKQ